MCVLRVQQLHDFQHRPDLVRQEYGELLYQRSFHLRSCFRQINSHFNSGAATGSSPWACQTNYLIPGVLLANLIYWSFATEKLRAGAISVGRLTHSLPLTRPAARPSVSQASPAAPLCETPIE